MFNHMKVLAIETSCDETAVAVIEADKKHNLKVLSNFISSQIKLHAKWGGVVPNLAAREHVKNISHVFKAGLAEAGIQDWKKEIDLIAATRGPGLGPALLVGLTFARTLASQSGIPIVGVNHMDGHVHANWLDTEKPMKNVFPALNLVVSGGHTELVLMKDHNKYKIVGETLDDAVGEAFDKVARLLGLGYPGGPIVSKRAAEFKEKNPKLNIVLPRPMAKSKDFNFSYSGLKTAVLYKIKDIQEAGFKLDKKVVNEMCHEFQNAATEVLVEKAIRAAKKYKVKAILLSGGVSANSLLRSKLSEATKENKIKYFQPQMKYTTDNAAMIAAAGYFQFISKKKNALQKGAWKKIVMNANLSF
jgi:N6-L-threonylcarbamoyladenine synthase